ncbi:hypothetical protein [Okeania sp.]|uniref:hypothetical protein n=1 Tax=Okeania sp. TaxID=3100323 RepID=UPI002B4B6851|nr:hypothetical protein [Okeania sp.]MEB3340366.1 hypothetical protein [Okeania sp.]
MTINYIAVVVKLSILDKKNQIHGKLQNDYVRLIGIDGKMKQRIVEKIIHRPN